MPAGRDGSPKVLQTHGRRAHHIATAPENLRGDIPTLFLCLCVAEGGDGKPALRKLEGGEGKRALRKLEASRRPGSLPVVTPLPPMHHAMHHAGHMSSLFETSPEARPRLGARAVPHERIGQASAAGEAGKSTPPMPN